MRHGASSLMAITSRLPLVACQCQKASEHSQIETTRSINKILHLESGTTFQQFTFSRGITLMRSATSIHTMIALGFCTGGWLSSCTALHSSSPSVRRVLFTGKHDLLFHSIRLLHTPWEYSLVRSRAPRVHCPT